MQMGKFSLATHELDAGLSDVTSDVIAYNQASLHLLSHKLCFGKMSSWSFFLLPSLNLTVDTTVGRLSLTLCHFILFLKKQAC